jgi:hypothetical protein
MKLTKETMKTVSSHVAVNGQNALSRYRQLSPEQATDGMALIQHYE